MEDDINLNELAIILGLKYNQNELNKIIPNKKDLKFINAISNILYSDNLNNLYENNDSKESNNSEMIDNFIKNTDINEIGAVKLELYKDSNFIENIKGKDNLLQTPNINYSEKYLSKLQNDFIKEEIVIMKPIEIKKSDSEKYEINKKLHRNKKFSKKENNFKENKDNKKSENIEIKEEEKIESEKKDGDKKVDKEEMKEVDENAINDFQNNNYEEKEDNDTKKNDGNNNQHQNYRKPYNKKYNKNKSHKDFRQNLNFKKYKNYK